MLRTGKLIILALTIALGLALVACSDNTQQQQLDSGPSQDGPSVTDTTPPPTEIECANDMSDCKDYVASRLLIPVSAGDAQKYAFDFDNNGTKDNSLGDILATLASVGSFPLQEPLDAAVNAGVAILLFRLNASDFTNAQTAAAQAWVGKPTPCCSNPEDPAACKDEATAASGCFGGSYELTPDANSPKDALFGGSIAAGKFEFGPAKMRLEIPLTGTNTLAVNLKGVRFKGTLDGNKIKDGVLGGGIGKDELDNNLMPTVANMMDTALKDPNTSDSAKTFMSNVFDTDKDGSITADEVKNNPLIATLLAPDVDVNGDGVKELSLGIGFEGISAKIKDE